MLWLLFRLPGFQEVPEGPEDYSLNTNAIDKATDADAVMGAGIKANNVKVMNAENKHQLQIGLQIIVVLMDKCTHASF